MDRSKLPPHLRAINKQQNSTTVNGKTMKAANAEPPSSVQSLNTTSTSGSVWSGKRPDNMPSNVRGVSVIKSTPSTWNEYAGQASSSRASTTRQQPAAQKSLLDTPLPHLRGKSAAATDALQPTTPMNAGTLAKSAKQDSKVPCTYADCTRGFTKETDMKRHKDEDHEWCRLCNVDCADDLALLEHKVQSEMHICCDVCGEDFRSENGKERHMRQVSSSSRFPICREYID